MWENACSRGQPCRVGHCSQGQDCERRRIAVSDKLATLDRCLATGITATSRSVLGTDKAVTDDPYLQLRAEMVETQIQRRGITNSGVLRAMATVPRHEFVPEHHRNLAYTDEPLGIGEGQTISQPYIVAAMTEALGLRGTERVLDVGTGCGYQAAVLAILCKEVVSIEHRPELARAAGDRLHRLGFTNVHVHCGDGSLGLKEFGPYDAILVAAAAPKIPEPLQEQLSEGGRLIVPVGAEDHQYLMLVTRHGNEYTMERHEGCRFVPLIGRYGFRDWEFL